MTTTEKLNYIIRVLNEIIGQSETIGDLPDYTVGSNDIGTFIGVYESALSTTQKASIEDLLTQAANTAVGAHTHVIDDIDSLALAINQIYTDGSGNKWRVKRNVVDDFDFSRLIVGDFICGWEDDTTTQQTWIEGVVLVPAIVLPADINDATKFFITTKKIRL